MGKNSVIVIAFDGLDHEFFQKWDLENLKNLEEAGRIDNTTRIHRRTTPELFASFITGETWEVHGAKGPNYWTNSLIGQIENKIFKDSIYVFNKTKGLRRAIYESINQLDAERIRYTKEDLDVDTIFEKIENSRAMFVPGYNHSPMWGQGASFLPLESYHNQFNKKYTVENWWKGREHRYRKEKLWNELNLCVRSFLMCHFHRPDIEQHLYGDKELGKVNTNKIKRYYLELDDLAGKIIEKSQEAGYDEIIFMSDHGVPEKEMNHNKNAWYASSTQLFENQKPHITDFYDKILEITDQN